MKCIDCGLCQPRPGEVLCAHCLEEADDACVCGHGLLSHYRAQDDEGCVACNHRRITTGEGALCRRYTTAATVRP